MKHEGFAQRVTQIGALADPIRRALYAYIASQPKPVGRDQAAAGVGVPRHTAKHHLDLLVEEGLLATEFRRLTGRSGPGAGRPAKLYRRTTDEVAVSLPARRYDLAGEILADAVSRTLAGEEMETALEAAAARTADELLRQTPPLPEGSGPLERMAAMLELLGYEPRVNGEIRLDNCPFHRLALKHTELVCNMNFAFIEQLRRKLGEDGLSLALEPAADRCCVCIRPCPDCREQMGG